MKVFISADIEGVTAVSAWDEAGDKENDYKVGNSYRQFARQMTEEVNAACRGARAAGASEIVIKDSHATGRNLCLDLLQDKEARYIRGWSGDPLRMIEGIDESFSALIFIGYHSAARHSGNPLSHTITGSVRRLSINGITASEFLYHSYGAGAHNVPVAFLSGDKRLTEHVAEINPAIKTLAVKEGVGNRVDTIHPAKAVELIEQGVKESLAGGISNKLVPPPAPVTIRLEFDTHMTAYRKSFFPGAALIDEFTVEFSCNDYQQTLRALMFLI